MTVKTTKTNQDNSLKVLKGIGESHFNLPSAHDLIKSALANVPSIADLKLPKLNQDDKPKSEARSKKAKKISTPRLDVDNDPVLFRTAEGIRQNLAQAKLAMAISQQFDPFISAFLWAKRKLPEKYQPSVKSLMLEYKEIKSLFSQALPEVYSQLVSANPESDGDKILNVATASLNSQLEDELTVLSMWAKAFSQSRDGFHHELDLLVFTLEQTFELFSGLLSEKTQLATKDFDVGNVFMAYLAGDGPATYPGSNGPIGAHLVEFPYDERKMLSLMLTLYMHEFRHNIFDDIKGHSQELIQSIEIALTNAYKNRKLNFRQKYVKIGLNYIPTLDFVTNFFRDTIGEIDADINGGVMLTGIAYFYGLAVIFSALNNKDTINAQTSCLLEIDGNYESIDKSDKTNISVAFEPHPPDYVRAIMIAYALELMGFDNEAKTCLDLTQQTLGEIKPDMVKWTSADNRDRTVLKLDVQDLIAASKIVVETLMFAKLKSLNGYCSSDIINWNSFRQSKVDRLVEQICQKTSAIPDDFGDVYATYIAAASILAYWRLVKNGSDAYLAIRQVEKHALKMLANIKDKKT